MQRTYFVHYGLLYWIKNNEVQMNKDTLITERERRDMEMRAKLNQLRTYAIEHNLPTNTHRAQNEPQLCRRKIKNDLIFHH